MENLTKIFLYGSYARGDFRRDSDINVVAIVDEPRQQVQDGLRIVWDRAHDLGLEYEIMISPTAIPQDEFEKYIEASGYFRNINNEGIIIEGQEKLKISEGEKRMSMNQLYDSGQVAYLGNTEAAIRLFEEYCIPYGVITDGEYAGHLRTKILRKEDHEAFATLRNELKNNGYGSMCARCDIFRDENDNQVFIFSPYYLPYKIERDLSGRGKQLVFEVPEIDGYESEISDYGVFSEGTKTVVMKAMCAKQ